MMEQHRVSVALENSILLFLLSIFFISTAGSDYVAQSNVRIRWQADQVDPRYISNPGPNDPVFQFTIIDDDDEEDPREYFEIDLSLNPTGNGRNGFFFPDAVGRVTILDNDSHKSMITHLCLSSSVTFTILATTSSGWSLITFITTYNYQVCSYIFLNSVCT